MHFQWKIQGYLKAAKPGFESSLQRPNSKNVYNNPIIISALEKPCPGKMGTVLLFKAIWSAFVNVAILFPIHLRFLFPKLGWCFPNGSLHLVDFYHLWWKWVENAATWCKHTVWMFFRFNRYLIFLDLSLSSSVMSELFSDTNLLLKYNPSPRCKPTAHSFMFLIEVAINYTNLWLS